MNNEKKIHLIKIICWYGAVLDVIVGIKDMISSFIDPFIINNGLQLAIWYRGLAIFLYTYLLIWAVQDPARRRFVILGVIVGISAFAFGEMMFGFIPLLFDWLSRIVIVIIPFSVVYIMTMNVSETGGNKGEKKRKDGEKVKK